MNKQIKQKDLEFFYCYSPYLAEHITKCGIDYITVALNPSTKSTYSMFLKTDELQEAINSYKPTRK